MVEQFLRATVGEGPEAQRQMLEVVKALQSEPKVLVMDEPTTSLDPVTLVLMPCWSSQ